MAVPESRAEGALRPLIDLWRLSPEFTQLAERYGRGPSEQLAHGLSGSEKQFLVAGLLATLRCGCLYVVASSQQAERVAADFGSLLPEATVLQFPNLEILPYDVVAQSPEFSAARLAALDAACARQGPASGGQLIIVATAPALTRKLPPVAEFRAHRLELRNGEQPGLETLISGLAAAGYQRTAAVDGPGEFAVRGGILDLWPVDAGAPARAEFDGDQIGEIRAFDPETQRSVRVLENLRVPPASEFLPGPERIESACESIQADLEVVARAFGAAGRHLEADKVRRRTEAHVERFRVRDLAGLEQYLPYCYPDALTAFDYLPPGTLVVLDEPARLKEAVDGLLATHAERYKALLEAGAVLPRQAEVLWDYGQLLARARSARVLYFSLLLRRTGVARPESVLALTARPMVSFHGQWDLLTAEVKRRRADGRRVVLLVGGEARARRLTDALHAEGMAVTELGAADRSLPAGTVVLPVALESGFEVPSLNLAVITENEIYAQPKQRARPRPVREGRRVTTHLDLRVGDWVVHVNHGIGRYLGVTSLQVEGVRRDYLFLKYAGEDRLYVPTDQVELIQRYVGGEGHEPKLNRLGGTEWSRTKSRVRESVRVMAKELIELYAAREVARGHAFSADTPWQSEFEAGFPYEETPDQLTSLEEIKRDMGRPRPMDRLLCGDVGYGKTEVAIRAAFKAVMDGTQVAVLVPTTILAQQHHNTFRERFAGLAATIELLSRFRSPGQQRRTVAGLRSGRVDIVIGTHRLLSDDVQFHSLGLLVIDEEHRFGVAQKERIKQLRKTVDVLTLSATPIPRTLHMAMAGVRDMSLIETPPEGRFPVQTYVVEHSDELVRDAILRETGRGGQVFYVHNRVQTIDHAYNHLAKLVPEARIAVGHGQMAEDELERAMISFLEREYDILLCTTIIESGLDMANVNTLVVEDADHLGLAQLYQLRGRVGRSSRLAYAYFTYRRDKVLTEQAESRLDAIRQFTELGSGFKIAMRDLEIRGMGNLLGAEQHGFMAAVGLDLYVQLLQQAVAEMRGQVTEEEPQAVVELAVDALLPDDYVPDPGQKVDLYRRLVGLRAVQAVGDIRDELRDRFGEPPQVVSNLLDVARLRVLATRCGLSSVVQTPEGLECRFGQVKRVSGERLVRFVQHHRRFMSLRSKNGVVLSVKPDAAGLALPPAPGRAQAGGRALRFALACLEALDRELSE